jgi:uncharacterized membrane protein
MSAVSQQISEVTGRFTLRHLSLALVAIAMVITGYLSYTHLTSTSIVCVEGGAFNCETVNSSIYSRFAGIPVAYLGFAADLVLAALLLLEPRNSVLRSYGVMIVFGITLFGFIYHCYLTYVSVTRIQALCPWCLSAHAVMMLLLIVSSIRLYRTLFGNVEQAETED